MNVTSCKNHGAYQHAFPARSEQFLQPRYQITAHYQLLGEAHRETNHEDQKKTAFTGSPEWHFSFSGIRGKKSREPRHEDKQGDKKRSCTHYIQENARTGESEVVPRFPAYAHNVKNGDALLDCTNEVIESSKRERSDGFRQPKRTKGLEERRKGRQSQNNADFHPKTGLVFSCFRKQLACFRLFWKARHKRVMLPLAFGACKPVTKRSIPHQSSNSAPSYNCSHHSPKTQWPP